MPSQNRIVPDNRLVEYLMAWFATALVIIVICWLFRLDRIDTDRKRHMGSIHMAPNKQFQAGLHLGKFAAAPA